jgi:hypothetical protein
MGNWKTALERYAIDHALAEAERAEREYEQVLKVARREVLAEIEHPQSPGYGYNDQTVHHAILNAVDWLTNSDEHYEMVREAESEAREEYNLAHDTDY